MANSQLSPFVTISTFLPTFSPSLIVTASHEKTPTGFPFFITINLVLIVTAEDPDTLARYRWLSFLDHRILNCLRSKPNMGLEIFSLPWQSTALTRQRKDLTPDTILLVVMVLDLSKMAQRSFSTSALSCAWCDSAWFMSCTSCFPLLKKLLHPVTGHLIALLGHWNRCKCTLDLGRLSPQPKGQGRGVSVQSLSWVASLALLISPLQNLHSTLWLGQFAKWWRIRPLRWVEGQPFGQHTRRNGHFS